MGKTSKNIDKMNNLEKKLMSIRRPVLVPPLITADMPNDRTISQKYRSIVNGIKENANQKQEEPKKDFKVPGLYDYPWLTEEQKQELIEEIIKEMVDFIMPPVVEFYTGEQGKEHFKRVCHDAGIPDAMTDSMITEIKQ